MSTQPAVTRVPQALDCDEIKDGIVAHIRHDGVPDEVCKIVRIGLNRTCLLNHQSYSKFGASWEIGSGAWLVKYDLDDFGRVNSGQMGGSLPEQFAEVESAGEIPVMPPDTFRRRSEQPIPQPRTLAPKKEDAVGVTQARKSAGPKKMV